MVSGASFSPDGTTVVFAPSLELIQPRLDSGIYRIDAEGGVPRLLVEPTSRYLPDQDRSFRTGMYFPTFSPDGTRIAFFDGFGDNSHSLRVVNADGSDLQVLIDNIEGYRITNLAWSPDGRTLAFGRRINGGVYTIGVDGSGLTLVIPDGEDPHWSPDGSRIWYEAERGSGGAGCSTSLIGTGVTSRASPPTRHPGRGTRSFSRSPRSLRCQQRVRAPRSTWPLVLVAALLILVARALAIRRGTRRNAGSVI